MRLAKEVSTWSKDPRTKIGAVIVDDERRILSTGYNGFPAGIADDSRLYNREEKYPLIIHGETNAILNALRGGVSITNANLFVYGLPVCGECAKMICQSGIKRVVMGPKSIFSENEKWMNAWTNISKPMFDECGIESIFLDMKEDSSLNYKMCECA
jgi:dCMP deaminase